MQSHPEEANVATVTLNITNPLSSDFVLIVDNVDGSATGKYVSVCNHICKNAQG